jgi:hypothetical protein
MVLSARQEKSAGSGVGMNGYAILFHKTCVHPCINYSCSLRNALHYWRLLTYNVFGIGIFGVRMRSKITLFFRSYFPADFSWRAHSTKVQSTDSCGG